MTPPAPDRLIARIARIARLAADRPRVLLGIAGPPGVGRSTLAAALVPGLVAAGLPAVAVPMDGYHLADVALESLGRRDRKGAPDTFDADGYRVLLHRLRAEPDRPWPDVRAGLDEVWFLDLDDAVRTQRLVAWHVASAGPRRRRPPGWPPSTDPTRLGCRPRRSGPTCGCR